LRLCGAKRIYKNENEEMLGEILYGKAL
jgi:hypothetical protein